MSINKYVLLVVLLAAATVSGCEDEVRVTCEYLAAGSCPEGALTYDSSKAGRNVLIIGIDGFRADAMTQDISPFLHQLSGLPGVYYTDRNTVEDLTFSGPNWASLVTGVHWCKHSVDDNDYTDNSLDRTPHFFKWIEEANPSVRTQSIVNWTPINDYSARIYADFTPDEEPNDDRVFELALNQLQTGSEPTAMFLQFDELDGAGHSYGFCPKSEEYASTLRTIDSYIEQLHHEVELRRTGGEEWLVCVVSDHGGDGTSHSGGQDNEHIANTIFFAECPQLTFSNRPSEQVDLVPTVLDFLGIRSEQFECYTDGASLIEN